MNHLLHFLPKTLNFNKENYAGFMSHVCQYVWLHIHGDANLFTFCKRLCAGNHKKTDAPLFLPAGLPRKTAGIVFTHRPKIRFFAPQGRLIAPIQVKLCSTDGHLGPLGCAKFHVNRCRRVGMRPPKYQKFPLFGKESLRRGDSLDRFRKFSGDFIRLTILR